MRQQLRSASRCVGFGTAVAIAVGVAPTTARGASAPILLPSVRTALTPGPPVAGASAPTAEVLFPPGMTSDQRVLVGVDGTGKPVSVEVVQRLTLNKLGDYSFTVPGPIDDVEVAAGSDAEPGLRRDAILWSGFSAGHKTLAARATLRVPVTAPRLPLEVSIERTGNVVVVRGKNTSVAPGPVLLGPVSVRDVTKAFAQTRQGVRLRRAAPDVYVNVPQTPVSQSQPIAATLDVRGSFGSSKFRYRLGDGGPMDFSFRVPNAPRSAKLRLLVAAIPPSRLLEPPGAATWAEAVRRGRIDASQLLERLSRARLTIARALQYQTFLANPNSTGDSTAVYVYETAKQTATVRPSTPAEESGDGPWTAILLTAFAVVGAGGLVVLWAHS